MKARKQSTTTYPIPFLMVDSADHITGKTGLTPTVTISKNGGAFGAPSGAVTEIGSGWYALAGNATDRNTLGELLLHATAAGADPVDDRYEVVSWDPFADVAVIKAKTDTIGSLSVTITSPVATDGTVTIEQGDSYNGIVGGTLPISVLKSGIPYDLTGASARLKCDQATFGPVAIIDDGTNWVATFEPTAAQTATLTMLSQPCEVEASWPDGKIKTYLRGTLRVNRDIPAVS